MTGILEKITLKMILYFVGLVVIGGGFYFGVDYIGDAREVKVRAKYDKEIKDAKEAAGKEKERLQNVVDEKSKELLEKQIVIDTAVGSISNIEQRMRSLGKISGANSHLPSSAIIGYAAEVERDFEDCRGRYVAVGKLAAESSNKVWAYHDSWPSAAGEKIAKPLPPNKP